MSNTCPGFAATLDMFGYSVDSPNELVQLAADLATERASHPVFAAMALHLSQCAQCTVTGDAHSTRVKNPRFGRVA